jgi:hypothetical protein
MTNAIAVRPATFIDAHAWWAQSHYPLRAILTKESIELRPDEVRRILKVGRRYFVEIEGDGLIHRIVLRDLPAELAGVRVELTSLFALWFGREALKELRHLTSVTAVLSLGVGIGILIAVWPMVKHSAPALGLTLIGCIALLPLAATGWHAAISLRRSRVYWIRRAVKCELVIWMVVAILMTVQIIDAILRHAKF